MGRTSAIRDKRHYPDIRIIPTRRVSTRRRRRGPDLGEQRTRHNQRLSRNAQPRIDDLHDVAAEWRAVLGAPQSGGNLVLEIRWSFIGPGGALGHVTDLNTATVAIDPAVTNDKTVTLSSTVPAAPTVGGLAVSGVGVVALLVAQGTTAGGSGHHIVEIEITP